MLLHVARFRVQLIDGGVVRAPTSPGGCPDIVVQINAETADGICCDVVVRDQCKVLELFSFGIETRYSTVMIVREPYGVVIVDNNTVGPAAKNGHFPILDRIGFPIPFAQISH